MKENDAPCKDCEFRSMNCHSQCDIYKSWRSDRNRKLEEEREQKKVRNEYIDYRQRLFSKKLQARTKGHK